MRFSIITPINKVPPTFKLCFTSVVKSSYDDFEWIIILNGDIEKEALSSFKSSKIKLISSQKIGVSAARNKGIRHAKGEYIIFLDSDDVLDSNYLETLDALVSSKRELDCIASNGIKFYQKDLSDNYFYKSNLIFSSRKPYSPEIMLNFIGSISGFVVKKNKCLLFDDQMRFFEDYDFYIRLHEHKLNFYFSNRLKYYYFVDGAENKYELETIQTSYNVFKNKVKGSRFSLYQRILLKNQSYRLYARHTKNYLHLLFYTALLFIAYPRYAVYFLIRLFIYEKS